MNKEIIGDFDGYGASRDDVFNCVLLANGVGGDIEAAAVSAMDDDRKGLEFLRLFYDGVCRESGAKIEPASFFAACEYIIASCQWVDNAVEMIAEEAAKAEWSDRPGAI